MIKKRRGEDEKADSEREKLIGKSYLPQPHGT